jgi:hypothetical protein
MSAKFDENGCLPEGVHPYNEDNFRNDFVIAFPASAMRAKICDGFYRLRADVLPLGVHGIQWIDGSFVTAMQEPDDVDVVTFCDYDLFNSYSEQARDLIDRLLNVEDGPVPKYMTHTFFEPCCAPTHHYYPAFEARRRFWRRWFGKTRDIPNPPSPDSPGHAKGFASMMIGDIAACPPVSIERGK